MKNKVTVETRTVPLADVLLNPKNPRIIKDDQYKRLVKSLREFPEMLSIREIVVDETMTVLGGNMRLRALQELKAKTAAVRIVSGLTEDQKREFIVKDNAAFGEWDWDALANEWDSLPLADWGADVPEDFCSDKTVVPPNDFKNMDENIDIEHECPKCGYKWSGGK